MDYILPETNLIQIKTMEKLGDSGLFVIEPLSPGYGVTLGNSLRRVLLSSLSGAAITSVKIDGATHEFSTLPGLREDIVEVILNLKTLRFRLNSDEPVTLKMFVKGPKEVKASDFESNSSCEVVNKDAYIGTLAKNGKLNFEVVVEKGRGYLPVEKRREEKMSLGTIAVDSIFTPVKKIHYEVENTRVGGQTDFDKLTIDITTDGTMDPEIALKTAAGILVEHFDLIGKAFSADEKQDVKKEVAPK
ncbi:MAG: DNA-directed RNA polymerase subunit alpha, partial [Candidatus Berkelbacteria bacterium]|nr:DNA-directed RNA polymerase subunit alpha [Candidatus Berkelbacteria bacterium]